MNTGKHGPARVITSFGRACRRLTLGAIVLGLVLALGIQVSPREDPGPQFTPAQQAQLDASGAARMAAQTAGSLGLERVASRLAEQADLLALPGMKNDGGASPSPTASPDGGGTSPGVSPTPTSSTPGSRESATPPTPTAKVDLPAFSEQLMSLAKDNVARALDAPRDTARLFAAIAASQGALARSINPKITPLSLPASSAAQPTGPVCSEKLDEPTLSQLVSAEHKAAYANVLLRNELPEASWGETDARIQRHQTAARELGAYANATCRLVPAVDAAYEVGEGRAASVLQTVENQLTSLYANAISLTDSTDRRRMLQSFLTQANTSLSPSKPEDVPAAIGLDTDDALATPTPTASETTDGS